MKNGELFLDNLNIAFKKPSIGYWKYTKMGYETFDRKNNVYVLNDNYGIANNLIKKVLFLKFKMILYR